MVQGVRRENGDDVDVNDESIRKASGVPDDAYTDGWMWMDGIYRV